MLFRSKTVQCEDEIAGCASAVGAAFAGALAVTTTSGPGVCLKSEAMNLAVIGELPLVIVNVQRGGPSTGLPTKSEQTDLLQALYGRNGESPMPVIAATSPTNCFDAAYMACKMALEHMTPVVLLTDAFVANGSAAWKLPNLDEYPAINPPYVTPDMAGNWTPYQRNPETGVRYWATPGTEGFMHRIGGLEKSNETGAISTEPENHNKMVHLRQAKVDKIADYIPELEVLGDEDADLLIVGWGGTYGHLMPTEPPMRMLVIPANSSASSFLKILGDNDGIGLLFESEGDTLSQTLKSDYGNYSDVLRKAFHHELVSLSRRKDREYCEVANPRVSVALAGTPEQVRQLIPDAENGLMSRFCFYIIRFKRGIRNVFATSDISQSKNAMFKLLGDKFCHLHEEFVRQGNYSFSLPSDLQEQFIEYLSRVNEECCDEVDNKMQGVVRRMGLIAYRIMMVLTAVRHLDNVIHKSSSDETVQLVCHEFDYSIAMSICDTLLYHAVFIYQNLSGNQSKRFNTVSQETGVYARRNTLYNMLPDTFTKKDYDAVVLTLGENGSTANKWIEAFIKDGKLCRIEQGKYRKIF